MKPFTDSRRIFWLGGVLLLVFGLVAAFVILPAASPLASPPGAEIRVPKMENVPNGNSPPVKLELEKGK